MSLPEYIYQIKKYLVSKGFDTEVDAAVILGSGLGTFGDHIEHALSIPYHQIPSFPQSTVEGHSGSLLFGKVENKSVLAFSGRFHHYEGHSFAKTVLPVQLAHAFATDKLIISNAAGGINLEFRVGNLMVIDNIIRQNMMVSEPAPSTWKYNLYEYADRVYQIADELDIPVRRGTYLYVKGPNYETKAEIRAFRKMGGDAVGMSTAPELMEAAKLDMKAAAISLITNAAAGVTDQKLDHAEVKEAADLKKEEFARLVKGLVREL